MEMIDAFDYKQAGKFYAIYYTKMANTRPIALCLNVRDAISMCAYLNHGESIAEAFGDKQSFIGFKGDM